MKMQSQKGSVALHIILITLLGIAAYSNTLNVPFQFDDRLYIVDNPVVKDLNFFIKHSTAKAITSHAEYSIFKNRYAGFLTFALNYKFNGLNAGAFHAVNISIHLINAVLVYMLVLFTFQTPFMRTYSRKIETENKENTVLPFSQSAGLPNAVALLSAILFVSHPVQTQAVTYIAQRFASLATMFYLISIVLYIKARQGNGAGRQGKDINALFYGLSILSCVIAMKTKETSFTLPLVIVIYELIFFMGPLKRRLLYLMPLLCTMLIIPITLIDTELPLGEIIGSVSGTARGDWADLSKSTYLFTQFTVITKYFQLIFLPIGQNLDYDWPVHSSFLDLRVFMSFLFLLSVLCLSVYLFYRSSRSDSALRIVSFGIFWFFIALSVESSVIPIRDVIFEHRVYLPSAGAFLAIGTGAVLLMERLKNKTTRNAAIAFLIVIPLMFSYATYSRNAVWKSEISLWEDVAKKSPGKARAYHSLGDAYQSEGLVDKAIGNYLVAIGLRPNYLDVHNNLGTAYRSKGAIDKAIEHYSIATSIKPESAESHNNLGSAYWIKGLTDKSIEHHQIAIRLKPEFEEAHYNLGYAYWTEGLTDKSIEHHQIAIRLKPDYVRAHFGLGNAYMSKGMTEKAIEHFESALRLDPEMAEVHNNLAAVYMSKGMTGKAIENFENALRLDPEMAEVHNNLAAVYMSMGSVDKAIEHFQAAVRIRPDHAGSHYNLGFAYFKKGFQDKARRELQTALKINPDFHEARQLHERINK